MIPSAAGASTRPIFGGKAKSGPSWARSEGILTYSALILLSLQGIVCEESDGGGERRVNIWGRVLALSVGGVVGVNARYWLGMWIGRWASPIFPWATFVINVSGAFVIGFLGLVLARWSPSSPVRLLAITGFLGGYTTFSSFAWEGVGLYEKHEFALAVSYLLGSVTAGFVAVLLGMALARVVAVPAWEWATRSNGNGLAPISSPDREAVSGPKLRSP